MAKGAAIQMRFVSEIYDIPYRIVGFAAIENRDGTIAMNDGWEIQISISVNRSSEDGSYSQWEYRAYA